MRTALALAIPLFAAAATNVNNWDAAGNAWWGHVQYLADDKLEGRNVGSPGFEAAADYVVEQFERAGLRPGRQSSYSQPVAFNKVTLDESNSGLTLMSGGQSTAIRLGDEALITSTGNVPGIEAPLVFAGYGLDIPEAKYSDLKDPALKGAIAVYLAGGPSNISAEIRSHHASGAERGAAMKAAGIIASIAIPNPRSMDIPWLRQTANRLLPRMGLADPAFAEPPPMAFSVTWNPSQADELFAGSGHTIAEILDAADHDRPLPHFALTTRMRAQVATTREKVDSRNIAGLRPGSSRALRNQYVILSAHLDHLGTGEKIDGDGIFNGAMDNAAGVASLIEIARALQSGRVKTKRSILFLALTGEEKGELGSRYFAEYPTMHGRIVADINMDMYLPLFPLRYLEVQGLNESSLGDDIRAVASAASVEIQADKDPNANRFIRSDQYSFVKKGVPALAFKFGWIPGSPEEKIFRDWYRDRYHAVGDDVNQPVDRGAAAKFNSILLALLERVADAPAVPRWKPDSYFKVFAK
jgi:hypothetical protein